VSNTTANPTCVTIKCGGTLKAIFRQALSPCSSFTSKQHSPEVTFDASSSYDLDGYIVSYTWDFGDGNVITVYDPIVTHHYSAAGTYEVTLTVVDNDGLKHSVKQTLVIKVLEGDLNNDGTIDIIDIAIVARAFGSKPGEPRWNELADLDKSGKVDIRDITKVAREYGKTY
jgi:PKD repeat protein